MTQMRVEADLVGLADDPLEGRADASASPPGHVNRVDLQAELHAAERTGFRRVARRYACAALGYARDPRGPSLPVVYACRMHMRLLGRQLLTVATVLVLAGCGGPAPSTPPTVPVATSPSAPVSSPSAPIEPAVVIEVDRLAQDVALTTQVAVCDPDRGMANGADAQESTIFCGDGLTLGLRALETAGIGPRGSAVPAAPHVRHEPMLQGVARHGDRRRMGGRRRLVGLDGLADQGRPGALTRVRRRVAESRLQRPAVRRATGGPGRTRRDRQPPAPPVLRRDRVRPAGGPPRVLPGRGAGGTPGRAARASAPRPKVPRSCGWTASTGAVRCSATRWSPGPGRGRPAR